MQVGRYSGAVTVPGFRERVSVFVGECLHEIFVPLKGRARAETSSGP